MVFRFLIQTTETPIQQPPPPPLDATMASSTTVKSQPLHNFSLPDLKWAMNHTSTNRFRKLSDSSHKSPPNDADCDAEYPRQNPVLEGVKIGGGIERNEKRKPTVVSDDVADNSEKKHTASSDGGGSKIFIRIRTKNSKIAEEVADAGDQSSVAEDAEESVPKTWNLRPRRLVTKVHNHNSDVNGGAPRIGGPALQDNKAQAPTRSELTRNNRNVSTDLKAAEKKEKVNEKRQKFSISLSKEEIEEDFLFLTGSKPPKRPKKRARNMQKQLDFVFPGLWLASITPDAYRVNDGANKG